jgi:predicted DNA binding protein
MRLELRMPANTWYSKFTTRHPDLLLEVASYTSVPGGNTLAEVEVYGPAIDWTHEISEFPDVFEVDRLSLQPELGRYSIRYRQTSIIGIVTELEILVRYPRTVQNGVLTCETIARLSQLRRLLAELRGAGTEPHLTPLHRDALRSVRLTLTASQSALFRQALSLGYFEVPRRISLTQLAQKVARSKSSVSEMLAVVERKLAHFTSIAGG